MLSLASHTERVAAEHKDEVVFRGVNRLPRRMSGELYSMSNCGSRFPGCLYPRPSREAIETLSSPQALFIADSGVRCTVDGTSFKYGGTTKGTVTAGRKSMCEFLGIVFIAPDMKYYNYKTDTFGTWGTGTYPTDDTAVPAMTRVYSHSNRIWGFNGTKVYASKHADPFRWNQFTTDEEGLAMPADDDSYYAELNPHYGNILGMAPAENHMCFQTQHSTYEIFGDRPMNYDPVLVSANRGTVDGRSMVSIDGRMFSASFDGITAYTGSHPRVISYVLDTVPAEAIAGTDGRRYYVSVKVGSAWTLYAYDTALMGGEASAWYQEDSLQVIDFALSAGFLYALASDGKIYKFNSGTEVVDWTAETDFFNYGYLGQTITPQIKIEAEFLASDATLRVDMRIDNGEYRTIGTYAYEYPGGAPKYYPAYILPVRGSRFQFKFIGHGNVRVLTLVRDVIVGTDLGQATLSHPS